MAGYTNSFTKVNGELIDAPTFQQEYTALGDAFDATAGHKHDGTAAEGSLIPLISESANEVLCDGVGDQIVFSVNVAATKTAQVSIADGVVLPDVTNDVDLGSLTLQFKDGHFAGDVSIGGDANITTDANVTGNINLTGALLPTVTNTVDIGSLTLEIKDIHSAGVANLTNLTLDTGTTVSAIIDDDTMAADSDTALVTQGNIVAYVATEIAAGTIDGGTF